MVLRLGVITEVVTTPPPGLAVVAVGAGWGAGSTWPPAYPGAPAGGMAGWGANIPSVTPLPVKTGEVLAEAFPPCTGRPPAIGGEAVGGPAVVLILIISCIYW